MADENAVAQSETMEEVAERIAKAHAPAFYQGALSRDILSALRNERERAAKVADERAAFNKRLMRTHNIGDPMADLKQTRADEAEIIAKEIRSGE